MAVDGETPELTVKVGETFDLEKTVCSHGFFMMAPNRWDSPAKTLTRPLRLSSSPISVTVRISRPSGSGDLVVSVLDGPSSPSLAKEDSLHLLVLSSLSISPVQSSFRFDFLVGEGFWILGEGNVARFSQAQVRRMLRISEASDIAVGEFQKLHEESRERGFGRLFRSPTLFEDMVKCLLLCNCQWSRTLSMATALCELQLELARGETGENFQPKTPAKKEPKMKRGSKSKAALNMDNVSRELQRDPAQDASNEVSIEEHQSSVSFSDLPSTDPQHVSLEVGNFPSPAELATLDEDLLVRRCRLGYRAKRVILLAQGIANGSIDLAKLGGGSDEEACRIGYAELDKELSGISGFGPFTRANVLMCMGFYHKVPSDTETIRHLKQFHRGETAPSALFGMMWKKCTSIMNPTSS